MAHFSKDQHMIEAFQRNEDIHKATAAKIFGIAPEAVTHEQRSKAKTANFGIIYGISAFGLSQQLNISRKEAQTLIDDYFANFPSIKDYINRSIETARKKGYVETLFGRRKYLPDINSNNHVVRNFAERNAINMPIQGTSADIIKIAMINILRKLEEGHFKASLIIQVHDELCFDVPNTELGLVKDLVKEEMEKAVSLDVPLKADVGFGKNWLEAH
jgi:DNA polymerase-1